MIILHLMNQISHIANNNCPSWWESQCSVTLSSCLMCQCLYLDVKEATMTEYKAPIYHNRNIFPSNFELISFARPKLILLLLVERHQKPAITSYIQVPFKHQMQKGLCLNNSVHSTDKAAEIPNQDSQSLLCRIHTKSIYEKYFYWQPT